MIKKENKEKIVKPKKKNLSSLFEDILANETVTTKNKNKVNDTQEEKTKKIEELKELTTTPIRETGYNDMPHYNVLEDNYLQQADLIYLPTASFGFKYLLVVVDAHSKKCDAEPIKNKSSSTVSKALQAIYKHGILEKPYIIGVDGGTEFKDAFREYTSENDIILKVGHTGRHRQQSLVEAKNKIIGSNIQKILAKKELETGKPAKDWRKYLRPLIELINDNLPKPKTEVSNEPLISKNNYNLLPIGTRVRVLLDFPTDAAGQRLYGNFRSGDIRWSRQVHEIENFVLLPSEPPMYTIKGEKNIYRTRQQLLPVSHLFV